MYIVLLHWSEGLRTHTPLQYFILMQMVHRGLPEYSAFLLIEHSKRFKDECLRHLPIHTPMAEATTCTSGAVGGSVSCSRTLWHLVRRSQDQNSNLPFTERLLCLLNRYHLLHKVQGSNSNQMLWTEILILAAQSNLTIYHTSSFLCIGLVIQIYCKRNSSKFKMAVNL